MNKRIPYDVLAGQVFATSASLGQTFVPFLGAGVSVSGRRFPPGAMLTAPPPQREQIDQAISILNLNGKSKILVEMAIFLAFLMQDAEKESPPESAAAFFERLKKEDYPPSASELAELFSLRSEYTSFGRISSGLSSLFPKKLFTTNEDEQLQILQLLSRVTHIANPPEALTSITSYYEKLLGREQLWRDLRDIISSKQVPTRTHLLLAEAAKYHLGQKGAKDYLIITTNYDCLMEEALDHPELQVPYVVLTTTKGENPKVLIRCSENVTDRETLHETYWDQLPPSGFVLSKAQNLVIIYKIHGCLKLDYANEGLVISDNDYVNYVSQMNKTGMIPASVSELMRNKPLWFLGYSLSDWNVRSIYETVKKKSNPNGKEIKDYAVMYSVGDFERLFFEKNNITIFEAKLNDFVDGVVGSLPSAIKHCDLPTPEGEG